jgi:cytidylate kinase
MKQRQSPSEHTAKIAAEIQERDHRDATRAASPLVAAEDAIILDSTHLTIDDVVARAEELVNRVLRGSSA